MTFEILEEKEYQSFLDKHPLKSFVQTTAMGNVKKNDGCNIHYVGVKEKKKILCATMMFSTRGKLGKDFFYAPRGYLIDFDNIKLLKFFTENIKIYIKQNNGYLLKIEPKILHRERDIDGNIVKSGFDNTKIYKNLIKQGYIHNGFSKEIDLNKQVRWAFILPLEKKTEKQIFEEMRSNTKNHLRKAEKYNIYTRELKYEELNIFKKIVESSGQRKNFDSRSLKYYQNMYKEFKKIDSIKYIVAELNISDYIKNLKNEILLERQKLKELPNTPSKRGLIKEAEKNLDSLNKRLEQAKEIKQKENKDIISLAASMFMTYGNEIVYLFSGSKSEYLSFGGQYLIQWDMIKFGLKNKYKIYNFYGISGNFAEEDNRYGVFTFKQGFGGNVIEYLGDFDLVISKPIYLAYKVINKIKKTK